MGGGYILIPLCIAMLNAYLSLSLFVALVSFVLQLLSFLLFIKQF